jgi:hypothetical protein
MVAQDCNPSIDAYLELIAAHHVMVYRDCLMDSDAEKELRARLQRAWLSLEDDGRAAARVILQAAHHGLDPKPEFRDYHDKLRRVIINTRGNIRQKTLNLIGRRRVFDPTREAAQALERDHIRKVLNLNKIFSVETVVPQKPYLGYDHDDFVGCLVKLGLKTTSPEEPYEYVWVKNVDPFDDKDGSGDELGGFLMTQPRCVPGFHVNAYVSFKVSEIQDFREFRWEDEGGVAKDQGLRAIEKLYDVAPKLDEADALGVWKNMSMRERVHVVDFYELLTAEAERTLKRNE